MCSVRNLFASSMNGRFSTSDSSFHSLPGINECGQWCLGMRGTGSLPPARSAGVGSLSLSLCPTGGYGRSGKGEPRRDCPLNKDE